MKLAKTRVLLVAVVTACLGQILQAGYASAALPGGNGKIAFSHGDGDDYEICKMDRPGSDSLDACSWLGGSVASAEATINPVDVATQAGIYEFSRTFSITPWDFNSDWPGTYPDDFFYVRHDPQLGAANLPPSTLWRNQLGGTYADSGAVTGRTDKHGCAWGDYNDDRRPDLACTVGFGQNSRNELWRRNLDGTFTNVAGSLGVSSDTHGRYRYMTFIDANNDGYDDLYFARYYGPSFGDDGYPGDTFPNELRINQGPGAATPFAFETAPGYGLNVLDGARRTPRLVPKRSTTIATVMRTCLFVGKRR